MDAEDNLASRVASFSYYLKTGDQENLVQKINGGLVEDPISANISKETSFPSGRIRSSAPLKPSYAISFPNSFDSQGNLSSHRVASFPSLIDDQRPENFAFKVKPGPVQDPKTALLLARTAQAEKMNPTNGEIGVFAADKYFNMKLDYGNEMKHQELIHLPGMQSNLRSATPSVYSEASSWNSGNALLNNIPRNKAQTKPKIPLGRRIISSFGCSGPCMNSRTVYVADSGRGDPGIRYGGSKLSQPAGPGPKRSSGDPFAFPIPSSDAQSLPAKKKLEDENMEELRKSLDVFGSGTMKKGDIAVNLERKLSMLTWDAIPKASSRPTTTLGSTTTICDDMASDASSDLFEIENISGNGFSILQAAGDDLSGCMSPTTQYAPSEASIEWSVVTASAADFSSVISDYDEKNIGTGGGDNFPAVATRKNLKTKKPLAKEAQKSRSNGLLGCSSQRAVNVAETVHETRVERY